MGKFVHGRVAPHLMASPPEFARSWENADLHLIDGHPAGSVILVSKPPSGKCRILNVYWDPVTEKAVFEYEDEPVE